MIFCRLIPPVDVTPKQTGRDPLYMLVFMVMTRLDRDMTGSKINKISRSDCQY